MGLVTTLLFGLALAPSEPLLLTLLPDPWPARPRVVGYEYHQKDHHATPEFIQKELPDPTDDLGPLRFRVVGLEVRNTALRPRPARLRGDAGEVFFEVPAQDRIRRYFAVENPPTGRFEVSIYDPDAGEWLEHSVELAKKDGALHDQTTARNVAAELNAEDEQRLSFALTEAVVTVVDDRDLPVPQARILH